MFQIIVRSLITHATRNNYMSDGGEYTRDNINDLRERNDKLASRITDLEKDVAVLKVNMRQLAVLGTASLSGTVMLVVALLAKLFG